MEQVSIKSEDLLAVGFHNVIAHEELGGFNVFWAFGKPQLNFMALTSTEEFLSKKDKTTKKQESIGHFKAHAVLKLNNWNHLVFCWKTIDHKNSDGKFLYTSDKEVKTGCHAGTVGMLKDGSLVFVPDAIEGGEVKTKAKTHNPF